MAALMRKRHHLVDGEVDADALRRGLAVADGHEGAAGRRAQQVEAPEITKTAILDKGNKSRAITAQS